MIHVHGYLGELSPATRELAARAALVVGGRRHLADLGVEAERQVVLGALSPALERLAALDEDQDALVIASGDPGFHGIVRRLRLAGLPVEVTPAVSSVSAAFAAVALPWDDAVLVSAHGQPLDAAIAAAATSPKVAVLTGPGSGVAELAAALHGLGRTFVVAERLGEADQRVRILDEDSARAVDDVAEPNVVLVLAGHPDSRELIAGEPVAPAPRSGIGQLTNSAAARRHADQIDTFLGEQTRRYDGPAAVGLPQAWRECELIISHLALGATVRLLAPLLGSKRTDPGVVVVDEAGRFAIPVVGGHAGGANDLSRRVAEALGGTPVLTTATDALDLPALDTLGWPYSGDVAGVTRAMLDGDGVLVERDHPWPLPPLPAGVAPGVADPRARIRVTDRFTPADESLPTVTLNPPSLVAGMGCNRGTSLEDLEALLLATLSEHELAIESLTAIATVDAKASELGLVRLAAKLGVPLVDFPAAELATRQVPNPSEAPLRAVGTPSVAEAAVLARGAELIVGKTKTAEATCAIGRFPARGKLSVVGLGPGSRDLLTPRAVAALRNSTLIVGYGPYVKQIRDLARPGTTVVASKMGTEEERTARAIAAARVGENVSLVCGGDPAVYAMASPVLEQGTDGIDVDIVPGVTASLAASAILGAALGHDHATISLSDLHTSWEDIERRLHGAAVGDFVVALYNPRSRKRLRHLPRALEILGAHRATSCPIAVVQQACRPRQKVIMSTLGQFDPQWVDMNSIVIVGSTSTRYVTSGSGERKMVTPRDYHWMPNAEEHA